MSIVLRFGLMSMMPLPPPLLFLLSSCGRKVEVSKLSRCKTRREGGSGEEAGRLIDRHLMDSTEQMEQLQSPEVAVHPLTHVGKPRQDLLWAYSLDLEPEL